MLKKQQHVEFTVTRFLSCQKNTVKTLFGGVITNNVVSLVSFIVLMFVSFNDLSDTFVTWLLAVNARVARAAGL